ncbi:helix-turn-helix domain-containing protein [Mycobacteroides chelonae]|uniref:helix-turn-helix domain-containing protein n=1 Tax=Mycobacteroides chelonae TaxID=1774 RepID=UPI0008AA2DB5|nr:helix-turn-helix transcriptional regulator [Mycobacteroides chelonae]OHU44668.1 hypothetical protein BKG78_05310 [Mycobacteroides chelonae]
MDSRRSRREKLELTQSAAAARAGVSVATWRRWEEDAASVSADTQTRCESVLDQEQAFGRALEQLADNFCSAWKDCHYLTPRQAYALAGVLNFWADHDIGLWLQEPSGEPLHEIAPFNAFDRRVMVYVNDNKAWAEKARERCYAVADEIERGSLPFDRDGCLFDELLMAVALEEAKDRLADMPELFERVQPRAEHPDHGEEYWVLDDDWDLVSDEFDDQCRWDEWEIPATRDHPLLAAIIADRHPYTWFDPTKPSGAGYLQRLMGMVVDQPDEAE